LVFVPFQWVCAAVDAEFRVHPGRYGLCSKELAIFATFGVAGLLEERFVNGNV
jgi:hypothetical protein